MFCWLVGFIPKVNLVLGAIPTPLCFSTPAAQQSVSTLNHTSGLHHSRNGIGMGGREGGNLLLNYYHAKTISTESLFKQLWASIPGLSLTGGPSANF